MASTLWLIWDDWDRAWKKHQVDYMNAQASLSHLDALILQTDEKQKELEAARAAVEAAEQELVARADEIAGIESMLMESRGRYQEVVLDFGNLSGQVTVLKADYEHAKSLHGPDGEEARHAHLILDAAARRVEKLKSERDEIEDRNRRLETQLKDIQRPLDEARKAYDKFVKARDDAATKSEEYGSQFRRRVFNAPLLDFAAPFGTIGRFEIKQQVLHDIRLNVNFMDTYVVDRCQTCHVAIDDPGFSRDGLIGKLEQCGAAINEEMARRGSDSIPFPKRPGNAGISMKLDEPVAAEYLHALGESVNAYLDREGLPKLELEQPLSAHPHLDLYVRPDSPHPMAKMGCSACHDGNGYETDFALAAHTPENHDTLHEWEHKYVRSYGSTDFHTVEHYWDYPMSVPKYIESNCAKCHSQIADILQFRGENIGSTINKGRYLYTAVGCANCHLVKGVDDSRRVGPDLTHVASKLDSNFIAEWTFYPREYRPSTWMPHFFMQENNGPGSAQEDDPHPVERTRAETAAIAYYLTTVSRPFEPAPIPSGLTPNVEAGRSLFDSVGCQACHAALAHAPVADGPTVGERWIADDLVAREGLSSDDAKERFAAMSYRDQVVYAMKHFKSDLNAVFEPHTVGADEPVFTRFAPELSSIGSKFKSDEQGMQWLYDWLRDPRHYSSYTKMPSLRLTEQEALDLAAYLMTLRANTAFEDKLAGSTITLSGDAREQIDAWMRLALAGQNSEARTGDIMNDVGGELTGTLISGLTKSLGEEVATALVEPLSIADKRALFVGSKAINHYGCYACHTIPGFEETVRPGTELSDWGIKDIHKLDFGFYHPAHDSERDESFEPLYPPGREDLIYWSTLGGENPDQHIMHQRHSFAWHKMKNPRIWDRKKLKDPLSKVKMPNFYFTDEQADAVVTYLLSRRPPMVRDAVAINYDQSLAGPLAAGRLLTRELNCVGCHKIENNVATAHQFITLQQAGSRMFDEVNAPPNLRGEGAKAQHNWFYGFLTNVEPLRPWLKIRMPSFHLTTEQASTLVEYFAAASNLESDSLERELREIAKYINDAHRSAGGLGSVDIARIEPEPAEYVPRPGDDWFDVEALQHERDAIYDYAVRNRLVHPSEFMVPDPDDVNERAKALGRAFWKAVTQAAFLKNLFETPFPFVDAWAPPLEADRYATGEKLLYELQCLKCHVFGDPTVPGSHLSPTAPNLNLTHRRLQPEWVMAWLIGPGRIQPGTKMPVLWPGGVSYFADFPEPDKSELETAYGAGGMEQMKLITDFLFDAGRRNATLVQPGAAELQAQMKAAETQPAEEDDWGDEESESGGDDDWE
jgi:cytochrome c2